MSLPAAKIRPLLLRALRLPLLFSFLFCESAWLVSLAPTDVTRYHCYALVFWFGSHAVKWLPAGQCAFLQITSLQPAFHILPLEYPPLVLLPFSLPLLVPLPYYALAFALSMVLVAGLIFWLLVRFQSQQAATRFLLLLALGAGALFQVRYDLLPAVCLLICLLAAERQRWSLAYTALAFGVALKLSPIVALPALFIAEQQYHKQDKAAQAQRSLRWQWRHAALFACIVLGVTGSFALLNARGAIVSPVSYFFQRPPQIESLQSSFLWLAHIAGVPAQIVSNYGSLNMLSPLANQVGWLGTCLCFLGCLLVLWRQWQQRFSLGQAMFALLAVLIITGKVFSPQYLLWLLPLVASVGASRLWLFGWGVMSLLTMGIYAGYYAQLGNPETAAQTIQTLPGFFFVVGIRNGLFLLATLAYLFDWFRVRKNPGAMLPAT